MSLANNVDRSMRILYVGNVPHEVAEGNLKELLMEYGLIVNFRLFKDATSQYAFCEYEDPAMAVGAIQSLSKYAITGQPLRVDMAATAGNRSPEELASLHEFVVGTGVVDISQAMDVSEQAPEEISKAVASLPPEQMFELMKQMKKCIENNPQEARNMLLQNPQLAYALLQAQVIMRIVDPEVALKILDRPDPVLAEPEAKFVDVKQALPVVATSLASQGEKEVPPQDYEMRSVPPVATADKDPRQVSGDLDQRAMGAVASAAADSRPFDPRFRPADPRAMPAADPRTMQGTADPRSTPSVDPRSIPGVSDPRTVQGVDPRPLDPRSMPRSDPRVDPRAMQDADIRVDPRTMQGADPRTMQGGDPRLDPRSMLPVDPRAGMDPRAGAPGFGPRSAANVDPRSGYDPRSMADPRKPPNLRPPPVIAPPPAAEPAVPEDEEKAALIMQVLQLSEEQISMLPPEQRQSIMVLKEQIARSQLTL